MKNNKFKKVPLSLSAVYRLLEPGPVILVSTEKKGKANIMTMSWHTMMDFEPPIVGIIMSNRNYSFDLLKSTKECVINIPTVELANQVVKCGNTTGHKIDKFKAFDLTQLPSVVVKPPLIAECFANLECKVIDMRLAHKYNFFILEVVKAWVTKNKKIAKTIHHCGKGNFVVDGRMIKFRSKMK